MIYNNHFLNATRAGYTAGYESEFFQGLVTLPIVPIFGVENCTHSYVRHGEAILMPPYRGPGSGSLAWVEFEVLGGPPEGYAVALDINNTLTRVYDDVGSPIDLTKLNGQYVYYILCFPWDVNFDNKVDIKDLVLLIKHFGEYIP